MKYGPGHQKLWAFFGLSYASFLTLPRVLMCEMPDEWQGKMADLLTEYDETFFHQNHLPTPYVMARGEDNRFCSWPSWVLNYRRPDEREIERVRTGK